MFSVLDLFTIGVGPSSSHTVGPMKAACRFAGSLRTSGIVHQVARVRTILYGSLSLTGLGHGTDRAIIAGLEGNMPDDVDTTLLRHNREACARTRQLTLPGGRRITFDPDTDVVFEKWQRLAAHPNGMRFQAFDAEGNLLDEQVWYSIGGGFIVQGNPEDALIGIHQRPPAGTVEHKRISDIIWANETAMRPAGDVRDRLLAVWESMNQCVQAGCCSDEPVLPGGLDVPRRAANMYRLLMSTGDVLRRSRHRIDVILESSDAAWVNLFALAVSEENAGGGRVVTAPTNGSAGIIPAVLEYYWHFVDGADEDGVIRFLLTAGAIGYLFKRNASISGAEVGCQGEVGSACSMAAAGLCEVIGGTVQQVENAAEIGIEHHLGLTCDPVAGLVQIPCIERNAVAANTAINAVRLAMLGNGSHIVTLDQAIRTMKQTGEDMLSKYKETAQGGLAVNVVEC